MNSLLRKWSEPALSHVVAALLAFPFIQQALHWLLAFPFIQTA